MNSCALRGICGCRAVSAFASRTSPSGRWHYGTLLAVALFMGSIQLAAQTTSPTVYVSTGAGQQLLAIDGSSGSITGVCNAGFSAEDVVVGPDGKLYIADTTGNKVWRLTPPVPPPPAAAPASSCPLEKIYDQATTASCTGISGSTCPAGPEGPSFLRISTLDLYFNTHGTNTGIWKIPNIAAIGSCAPSCPAPVQVIKALNLLETALPASASGEGLDFDIFGNLLAVDQANNQVLRAIAPGFTCSGTTITPNCATPFITSNLSAPFGVALNTCGDVLVASGKSVNRYDGTTGAFLDKLNFNGNNKPKFLEVDSANRLYVVTAANESGTGGIVFRFDPPTATPITSCALGSFTQGFSLALKSGLVTGLSSGNALGLGVSATNFGTSALSFTTAQPTNLYDFGAQHKLSVTCNGVLLPFSLSVTALKSRPTDALSPEVTFSPATSWPSPTTPQCPAPIVQPECTHYGSHHGFCTQYLEQTFDAGGQPISDANIPNYCSSFSFTATLFAAASRARFA